MVNDQERKTFEVRIVDVVRNKSVTSVLPHTAYIHFAKFSPDGKVAGRKQSEGNVTLKTPTGITVSTDGTIYVVDTVANAVVNLGKIP